MKIDYISDLHLDFYIRLKGKWEQKALSFLTSLLPAEKGEVLIIAGDLSHYNIQSFFALELFSTHYKQVIFVLGNHDYYLVANRQMKKYSSKSIEREIELKQMIAALPNVKLLSFFETFTYEGINFAGATSWYGLHTTQDKLFIENVSNDSVLIKGINIHSTHRKELENYAKLQQPDVIITHVPPIILNSHTKRGTTACYLNKLPNSPAKFYIFGHCHEQSIIEKDGATYCINALGYPDEKLQQAIQSIVVC